MLQVLLSGDMPSNGTVALLNFNLTASISSGGFEDVGARVVVEC